MHNALDFPDLLRLIDERSTAFRAAIASAPSLDLQVPTCPEWTLFDLAQHIGEGRRDWAATVTAGPGATSKASAAGSPMPRERDALQVWLAESTRQLLDALREAGPDRGCWTWWGESQSPPTCRAVARHQLQQMAVHTYDAQLTAGAAEPLSQEVALDGVEDFLFTCCATTSAWPHEPAVVDYRTTEGRSWRVRLSSEGARIAAPAGEDTADASAEGTASELVLALYGRIPLDSLKLDGDRRIFDQLVAWDPDA
ncbi:maleylpyruvate isomerase family mycothiol-dependent enzyme [Lentzea sp. PSKA42]|uniref:Maleylpyruvate isomerase family mycothiol-dependent enzyme n=1 Tax=Lentzea indica TaxID=2604800 RepID=A0ABX1FQ43_9PSEU|nr:maleylpyruvate isomerase family mycothiol-dependent enzyme [Lentzea indica]NKE61128.1 maleylpyruvate isomerase family mycothiol-dependent enzyme [Lentzea indica]